MKFASDVNTSFLPQSNMQYGWDSTSIGALKTCGRFYQYTIIEGWQPKRMPAPLSFGILFHEALEFFHHKRAQEIPFEESVELTVKSAASKFDTLSDSDTVRSPLTMIRAIVWYLTHYHPDPLKTVILENGLPAVELSFTFELTEVAGETMFLSGHIDWLAELGGELFVVDYKTSKMALNQRFFEGFSPGNQVSLYTLASQVVFNVEASGVIIDGIQLSPNFCRFQRQPIYRTADQLDEWLTDVQILINQAAQYAEANYYPMNDTSCDKFGSCRFREICSKGHRTRDNFLRTNFTKRVWDPLRPRGEDYQPKATP